MATTLVARWWNGRRDDSEQDICLYREGSSWYVTMREGGPGSDVYRWPYETERAGRRWVLELRANSEVGLTSWVDVTPEPERALIAA